MSRSSIDPDDLEQIKAAISIIGRARDRIVWGTGAFVADSLGEAAKILSEVVTKHEEPNIRGEGKREIKA